MPKAVRTWDSLSEFVDYCAGPAGDGRANYVRSSRNGTEEFTGTRNYSEAVALAFNWPEGMARVEGIRARIALKSQRVRKEVVSREAGPGVLAMGKFLAGHPQPYMNLEDGTRVAKGKGKVIRIILNCSVSATIDRKVIEIRGAAIMALCTALEQAGKRVEIIVANFANVSEYNAFDYRVTIKRADRKLNPASVIFALSHPSFLRRFMFAAKERETVFHFTRMGEPADFPGAVPADTIYMPRAHGSEREWQNEEAAAAWVRETLVAQGVAIR